MADIFADSATIAKRGDREALTPPAGRHTFTSG